MRIAREAAKNIGERMLDQHQLRLASIPHILTTFRATGLSESERLEAAYMMQKMIVEGFIRGINVPGLMQARARSEGMLSIGFNDSHIPGPNTIQFDRNSWRSQPDNMRFSEFANKFGTRLSSSQHRTQPPRMNAALRYRSELPRTGSLRSPLSTKIIGKIAARVTAAASSPVLQPVFEGLKAFQAQSGVAPPPRVAAPRYALESFKLQASEALQEKHEETQFQTRNELMAQGMDPMKLQMMGPRSGVASPRSTQGAGDMLAASGRPQRVVIYSGPGTWGEEVNAAKKNAEALGLQVDVRSSLSGVDYNQYSALIMPGGNSLTEYNGLGGNEANRLKQAINGGLNYMGHCAGAFLAGRLGIINGMPDYPSSNYYGGGAQVTVDNTIKWGAGGTRDMLFYGGPDLTGFGKELAEHPSGASTIISNDYGQGHLILTAGHPGVTGPDDKDGSDAQLYQQLIRAIAAGTDPDGSAPPTTGPTTPTTTTTTNTTQTMQPPALGGAQGAPGIGGGRTNGRHPSAPSRKTPVAGVLPENFVGNGFAADLQGIMGRASPMLQGLAGALQGIK